VPVPREGAAFECVCVCGRAVVRACFVCVHLCVCVNVCARVCVSAPVSAWASSGYTDIGMHGGVCVGTSVCVCKGFRGHGHVHRSAQYRKIVIYRPMLLRFVFFFLLLPLVLSLLVVVVVDHHIQYVPPKY
jgi:hypothetical protein